VVGEIAKRMGATTAQMAISLVCRLGAIPIPSFTKQARIIENYKPTSLTDEYMTEIQEFLVTLPISEERYGGQHETL
jgi:diketogulonate reductase-like aldo/keto reductase